MSSSGAPPLRADTRRRAGMSRVMLPRTAEQAAAVNPRNRAALLHPTLLQTHTGAAAACAPSGGTKAHIEESTWLDL